MATLTGLHPLTPIATPELNELNHVPNPEHDIVNTHSSFIVKVITNGLVR